MRKEEARQSFGFDKGMPELTVAMMLRGQTSHLSVDGSSRGGLALHASPGPLSLRGSCFFGSSQIVTDIQTEERCSYINESKR